VRSFRRALAADPTVIERTGQTLKAADLAREYGFTDVEPIKLAQPPP
jgi:hypothetical protein